MLLGLLGGAGAPCRRRAADMHFGYAMREAASTDVCLPWGAQAAPGLRDPGLSWPAVHKKPERHILTLPTLVPLAGLPGKGRRVRWQHCMQSYTGSEMSDESYGRGQCTLCRGGAGWRMAASCVCWSQQSAGRWASRHPVHAALAPETGGSRPEEVTYHSP